ncbi:putative reverse transcriptase domain-containing protein [Tanacetum coccineum]
MSESAKRHEENSNLIKEIRATTDAAIRNQGASIKTLEIQIRQISKVLQEKGFGSLPSSTETNPRDQVKSISTTIKADSYPIRRIGSPQYAVSDRHNRASVSVMPLLTYLNLGLGGLAHTRLTVELADRTVKYPKGIAENVLVGIGKFTFLVDFIILDMPEDIKVPLIIERPFLSTARSKIDVYKKKITLKVGEEKIIFKSIKPASSLISRVYMLGKVIEEFRTRDEDLDTGIDDYPSYCDDDKKINIDCAHNLKFSCMIGFEFTYVNFFLLLYVNVMSRKFHNLIKKNKMMYKGNNVVGAVINVPIFVGTFSIVIDFAVLENMDAYRDKGMGDVIVGEPFLREAGIKAKRFEGIITFYKGDDEVTYQMVRSHLRFKNYTNEQCNKIPPVLKVSEKDEKNEISHAYQKLKGFYKGVLNLGPDYIQNAKTEEWLTRGHISVHETE